MRKCIKRVEIKMSGRDDEKYNGRHISYETLITSFSSQLIFFSEWSVQRLVVTVRVVSVSMSTKAQ